MNTQKGKAAVLWTGGKDSCLALLKAELSGDEVESLITFSSGDSEFRAHPLRFMKLQAEAMERPHHTLEINEPYKESYEETISKLKEKYGIGTLITGDIAEVDGQPNWIRECSKYSGVDVLTPLWGVDRREHIENIISHKFTTIFSCVKKPWFTEDWVGRELNEESLEDLSKINTENGVDISGENGEYHTLVTNGPMFKKQLQIDDYIKRTDDSLMYMDIEKISLIEK